MRMIRKLFLLMAVCLVFGRLNGYAKLELYSKYTGYPMFQNDYNLWLLSQEGKINKHKHAVDHIYKIITPKSKIVNGSLTYYGVTVEWRTQAEQTKIDQEMAAAMAALLAVVSVVAIVFFGFIGIRHLLGFDDKKAHYG